MFTTVCSCVLVIHRFLLVESKNKNRLEANTVAVQKAGPTRFIYLSHLSFLLKISSVFLPGLGGFQEIWAISLS